MNRSWAEQMVNTQEWFVSPGAWGSVIVAIVFFFEFVVQKHSSPCACHAVCAADVQKVQKQRDLHGHVREQS